MGGSRWSYGIGLSDASIIVVAGIGNAIRCDDYVGVRVVEGLEGKTSLAVHLIECETVPESFVDEIVSIHPTHVLLIDAALLGLILVRPICTMSRRWPMSLPFPPTPCL